MADDPTKKTYQDRGRINLNESHEVRYWRKKWGVTAEELARAVEKVGSNVKSVAKELGQSE